MADLPLKPGAVRGVVRAILSNGSVSFSKHALTEMKKDGLDTADCVNVLRAGAVVDSPDLINGTWRYRVVTRTICVVIAFPDAETVRVVTAWRTE